MWFGNLVTMEWWNDIWLNEGFARFCEHEILDQLRPEYKCWDKYIKLVYKTAMVKDTIFKFTHPVQVEVPKADDLMSVFDTISYAKGSVICRMLADYVDCDFKTILKNYMHKF